MQRPTLRNMRKPTIALALCAMAVAASGCATGPSGGAIFTPWAAAGVHSFKPEAGQPQPSPAKVDEQVAQLLDNEARAPQVSPVRVAAK